MTKIGLIQDQIFFYYTIIVAKWIHENEIITMSAEMLKNK